MASPPTADAAGPLASPRATAALGVVLAGGRSRRFGRDKALEPVDGVAMAARVAAALAGGGASPVVAVGGDTGGLAGIGLVVWPDLHPGDGPLAAILTALTRADAAAVIVVAACDLPWLDAASVDAVVGALADPGFEVAVARTDRVEPLLSAWRVGPCRRVVAEVLAAGERSVHAALARLRTAHVPVERSAMRNVNRPGDLRR